MNKFFRFFFSIYGLTVFVGSFFIVFPAYLIVLAIYNEKKAPFVAHRVNYYWAKCVMTLLLIRIKIEGLENIDKNKAYVMVSNHRSQLDIVACVLSCSNMFKYLAKEELTKMPVIGYAVKKFYIPVNRKSREGRAQSITNMIEALKEGISVFIYPEGTRNKTDQPLIPFYDGAFRLAIGEQVPMAVLTIIGAENLLSPKYTMSLHPGLIRCIWSKPIETTGMTVNDIESLKNKVKQTMLTHLT